MYVPIPTDPCRFYLFEKYSDGAFKMHLKSAHFHEFDELVKPWAKDEVH